MAVEYNASIRTSRDPTVHSHLEQLDAYLSDEHSSVPHINLQWWLTGMRK